MFYLKATGDQADQQLRMTACDLNYTYPSGVKLSDNETLVDANVDKVWRVAVFASNITEKGGTGNTGEVGSLDPAASAAKSILAPSGAVNWESCKAVKNETSIDNVLTAGAPVILDSDIDAGVTKYYKVLVRAWLEGEDTTCNSATYAALESGQWKLDLDFELVDPSANNPKPNDAVTQISTNAWNAEKTPTQTAVATPIDVVTTVNG